MAKVSVSLRFVRKTEEAFQFYKKVFGGEFKTMMRWGEMPQAPGQPAVRDEDKNLVMHVELPIMGGFTLSGGDVPDDMVAKMDVGNNIQIVLEPDSKAEADRLMAELTAGGQVMMPMMDMFWGGYFGAGVDKYGINWMIDVEPKK